MVGEVRGEEGVEESEAWVETPTSAESGPGDGAEAPETVGRA